jgi:cysteine dioxygenase
MAVAGAVSIDEFVAAVLRFGSEGFAPEPMMRLLTETRLRESEMARYIHEDAAGEYTRTLIHRTSLVEILAITWPKGSATPIHDHAGQKCWMVAHEGAFVIEDFRQVAGIRAPGHAVVERTNATPGVTVGMPDYRYESDRDIHRVGVAPGCDRAVSLQIYARPYTSCLVFDEAAQSAREMRVDCVSPF